MYKKTLCIFINISDNQNESKSAEFMCWFLVHVKTHYLKGVPPSVIICQFLLQISIVTKAVALIFVKALQFKALFRK